MAASILGSISLYKKEANRFETFMGHHSVSWLGGYMCILPYGIKFW